MRLADEVELIDVAPQALQNRMKEGKIYAMEKVDQALGNFFKTGNLIALRELALREIADDVDERLEAWERKSSLRGPWRRQEVIFVFVNISPNAERLIRRGFRIAYRLKAEWIVTYVHCQPELTEEMKMKIDVLEKLTTRLGGKFEMNLNQNNVAEFLRSKAVEYKATQMIIGQSNRSVWEQLWKESIIKSLLRTARQMDILVVANYDPNIQIQNQ